MIKIAKPGTKTFTKAVNLTPFEGDPETANIIFKYLPLSEARALSQDHTVHSFLEEVIVGWNESDFDVPYSIEALRSLVDYHGAMGSELFSAYFTGLTESRAKN